MADKNFVINPGTEVSNYIQQISADKTYDIAVKQGITFYAGKSAVSGFTWDGSAPFEVVIPSVTDIIQDPVRLVAVVDAVADIPANPTKGDLIYIGTDGVEVAGTTCEAGDMAVYADGAWHVIQGENQVQILGSDPTVLIPGAAAVSLLEVEGNYLNVAVSMPTVNLTKNDENEIAVADGTVTVSGMRVALSKTTGASTDITTEVSIALPTALSNGAVTINENVLQASDFTFTSGAYPTITKNSEAISVNTSHSMTIAKNNEAGDFVTAVSAIKSAVLETTDQANAAITYVASVTAVSGAEFVNGIHAYTEADAEKTAAFNLWGQVTVSASNFATGSITSGSDLVTDVTVGAVTLESGEGILTGIDANGSDFVTSVNFGSVVTNNSGWFVTSLGEGTDVVTDVTVGAVSFVSGNADFAGSAITAASVENHVLSFNSGNFMTPVSLSKAADTISKGGFVKGGVEISGATYASKGFTTASLSQASSTITKGALATADLGLAQSSTSYYFDKAAGSTISAVPGYAKVTVASADVTKNGAVLENTSITATIPANAVAVDVTAGTLPTFSVGTPSASLTGSVATGLTTSEVSWLAVDPAKKDIAGADSYTLVSASEGGVEVAAAGTYNVDNATVTIDASTYVTDVTLS